LGDGGGNGGEGMGAVYWDPGMEEVAPAGFQ